MSKVMIRTYGVRVFTADILWHIGHFLKVLSERLEYGKTKKRGTKP